MYQISLIWMFFCFMFGLTSLIQKLFKKETKTFYLLPLAINSQTIFLYFLGFLSIPLFTQYLGFFLLKNITKLSHLDLTLFLAFISELLLGFFLYSIIKKNPLLIKNLCSNSNKIAWRKYAWLGYCESLPLLFLTTSFWYYIITLMNHYGLPITIEVQPIIHLLTENKTLLITKLFIGFSIIILAPICEELFFRGILLRFLNTHVSSNKSLCISALIFAAAHQHFSSFLPLFFLGYWLGYYYIKTGDLRTSIGIHALFNGTNFILIFITEL